MKKVWICAALLALAAGTASAAGINLAWNDCPPINGAGAMNEAATCTSNIGVHTLVGSYIPPPGLNAVNGNEMVIDLQTNQPALSPWWNMGTASGCVGRTTTPTFDFNFVSGPFSCVDYWAGQASGGGGYFPAYNGVPNRARIILVAAIAEALAAPEDPTTEYYSFKVLISNARTVGTPNCPGCTDAACLVLNSIKITQNSTETANPTITNAATSNIATWRSGLASCAVTPAHNTTWGSVKALYR